MCVCVCVDMDHDYQKNLLYFTAVEANGMNAIKVVQIQPGMDAGSFTFMKLGAFLFVVVVVVVVCVCVCV